MRSVTFPSTSYATATLMVSIVSSTSAFIMMSWSTPLTITANLRATRSSQPVLLGLPVVAPYSNPSFLSNSPVSLSCSVGNGPLPTLVQYALNIPETVPIFEGATPSPVHAPAHVVFEDVTKGYDPKSMSRSEP